VTRYDIDGRIPTLGAALSEHLNVDELKELATLTHTRAPTRKAALVEHICQYLEGDRLRAVWQGLDDLQKAAVAEVVHSPSTAFPAERFRAKYGRLPDFGTVSRGSRDSFPPRCASSSMPSSVAVASCRTISRTGSRRSWRRRSRSR
jgi:hypothetical protein